MTLNHKSPESPPPDPKHRPRTPSPPLTEDQRAEIRRLQQMTFGTRRIARSLGLGRKVVRRALAEMGLTESRPSPSSAVKAASKLDPFRERIQDSIKKRLTTTRILRELRQQGYTGGRTILADYIRTLRTDPPPKKKVWRRFETRPGEEAQFDWSPYRVALGGTLKTVHAFGATLGFSRKIHVRFYLDEQQPTLFEAHLHAFDDFGGVTRRGVYDRMATVVLGTIGPDRKPLWHPRFLEFAAHYGYEPYLCKPRDPDRKGKDERVFLYLERDFLRGAEFDSFEDLNAKARLWLDEVANRRLHKTTRRVPDEAWEIERPFLIALPELRFPACSEELRQVGPDSVLSIKGTPYTVPAQLAHQTVAVRLYAEHFEVLDHQGQIAFTRRYVSEADKGRLVIDTAHYDAVRPRGHLPGGSVADLEDALLVRFPSLAELCAGLRLRMKGLAHVHLRALWRLADRYGEAAFLDAATRAQAFHRFDAQAVRRILEREHPLPDEPEPCTPLTAAARVLVELGDVDAGSLDDYALNLTALRDELPALLARAEEKEISYTDLALAMLRFELEARKSRRLTRNLRRSGLPDVIEGLDGYDFSIRPRLEARVVKELLNGRWIAEGRNILCVGRPGLGKTRILDALTRAACLKGYTVKKVTTAEMLEDLHAALADGSYKRAFRRYEKPDVLYCDEFGYAPFDAEATKHLFRLVSARHRRRSILLAANTGFKNWKSFFPSEAQAVATVDRLIDQATILRFTGKGCRQPREVHGAELED